MITAAVGKRIAELRKARGLSQERFAKQIGMSRTYFAEVEVGKRNISMRNLHKIIVGLGVTYASFFDSPLFSMKNLMAE